jgi:hypothetical protein
VRDQQDTVGVQQHPEVQNDRVKDGESPQDFDVAVFSGRGWLRPHGTTSWKTYSLMVAIK